MKWGRTEKIRKTVNCGSLLAMLLLLQGCNDLFEDDKTSLAQLDPETEFDARLSGSVGDGPIVNAELRIIGNDGSIISSSVSDSGASYDLDLRTKGKYYPLTIDARGGTDLATNTAPSFVLVSAATEPRKKGVANVNPYTTLAVAVAKHSDGGLGSANISAGLAAVVGAFNAGLTSALAADPMTTPIDDTNLAEIVKSSEALAEIFRRTHAAYGGASTTIDDIIDALGADLIDGALDGFGAENTSRKISALTVLTASQVMIEAIVNELHVNGQDVTPTLDNIVQRLASGRWPDLTSTRPVTEQMITQAQRGVAAAIALADSSALQTLSSALATLSPGMSPTDAKQKLPADAPGSLDGAITTLATGSDLETNLALTGEVTLLPPPEPNTPPVISGTPPTSVDVGATYSFVPRASDADGDALTFSITGKPAWASFSAGTGAILGTPGAGDVGSQGLITISVSDGEAKVSLPSFWITVNAATSEPAPTDPAPTDPTIAPEPDPTTDPSTDPSTSTDPTTDPTTEPTPEPEPEPVNTAPLISGTPPTSVRQGVAYSFAPRASDADGDALTFGITGKPAWASFNTRTGALTGTPGSGDIGTYTGITISVSDGIATVQLAPFSITVEAASIGSATLTWVAPTENTDGSALTDLSGYKVRWGQRSGSYDNSVEIGNPGITTYVVENLSAGTYYFVVTALNSSSMESSFSNEASKTIN